MISCIRRKAAKLHLGDRQSAKVGKPAYAAAFIFATDSLQGRGQYGLVKGERGKGKGERFQIHQTSCTRVQKALLWSKGYIFIGERENTKHAPPFPCPLSPSGATFPFSRLLLEVYPLPFTP
ncbi:hypothetical protein VF14_34730 [Nostoc linckia z18]|uniref:Uncharacterized protein n=2 Tax=Nostoc linckia TaxID=92942 RepID=A0A9Q5Z4T8_NOSLI|nr:hypothetical protein VF02_24035 [Nostoc linckia z1]PHJ63164.1 hypothetical protein VF05_25210 [Nostoc linckia z3]PHJ70012.1 hypothetical protein VF03_22585 [Nostoc linckia z2]PHJ80740.1 hypothetical protein VF06_21390 [Nostoc linckia z4]PHJ88428.1 hypothetical protein VF07_16185 [Nostoc linckia z6]PHJ93361.1 hypothetical protein VF08_35595 [Nostoc linckia z8]PHJ96575.1 hypothetical protein VF04_15480 [Nostoc linckia z7]PHJ99234.1 hypothetical protein VF09_34565 [Nostoc linckia z9]PHK0916